MPASETREEQRNGRMLGLLFWGGVGLAPVAALFLLIGGGEGVLRAAVGVLTLSVILIGLSITLRRDGDSVRLEMEDMLFDEIDAVRADVRDDISTAAHATHRSFGEKLHYLNEQLEVTRGELDVARAHLEAVRHEVARLEMARVEAARAESVRHVAPQAAPASRHVSGGGQPPVAPGPNRPGMPPGMVRHTETVQVTTRHTIVDPHADDAPRVGAGAVYGSQGFDRGRPETPDFARPEITTRPRTEPRGAGSTPALRGSQSHAAEPAEESWTEQRLREQLERRRDAAEPVLRDSPDRWPSRESWTERPDADRWSERADVDRWSDRDDDDDRRPALRSGDRWASVRSDDRGRELRVGERRAALHSDESGTELRIEDRWAAVRREDARTGGGGSWSDSDDRLDEPPAGFPWRDTDRDAPRGRGGEWRDSDRGDRRAITGSDGPERWSDYDDYDERDRDRRRR
jgi:hypothetical protein